MMLFEEHPRSSSSAGLALRSTGVIATADRALFVSVPDAVFTAAWWCITAGAPP